MQLLEKVHITTKRLDGLDIWRRDELEQQLNAAEAKLSSLSAVLQVLKTKSFR